MHGRVLPHWKASPYRFMLFVAGLRRSTIFFRHSSATPHGGKTQCHYENLVYIENDLQRRAFGNQSSIERAAECHIGEPADWQTSLNGAELVGSIYWESHAPSG